MTGQQLKALIKSHGIKDEQMAAMLDVTRQGLQYQLKKEKPARVYVYSVLLVLGKRDGIIN